MPDTTEDRPAVRFDAAGGVVTLTLDRPETRNALSLEILEGLTRGLARAAATPGARVVVLSHTGPAFCAGADLRDGRGRASGAPGQPRAAGAPDQPRAGGAPGQSRAGGATVAGLGPVLTALQDSPLPVVARIGGHCLGGGVGLAAACDLSVAADDVAIGFTEVRLGVAPAIVSVVCLPKLRRGDALELFLTGERIPAARAAALGLITRAVPAASLDAAVDGLVASVLAGGPEAVRAAKSLVYAVPGRPRDEALAWATALSGELFASAEATEGQAAFREKRPPAWAAAGRAS